MGPSVLLEEELASVRRAFLYQEDGAMVCFPPPVKEVCKPDKELCSFNTRGSHRQR